MQNNSEFEKVKKQIHELDLQIMDLDKRFAENIEKSHANLVEETVLLGRVYDESLKQLQEERERIERQKLEKSILGRDMQNFLEVAQGKGKDAHFHTVMSNAKDGMIYSIGESLSSEEFIGDIVSQHDLESEIKSSMENFDVAEIREEAIEEIETTKEVERKKQLEMEMTPEEIRDFVDNEKEENHSLEAQIKDEKEEALNDVNASFDLITSQKQFEQEITEVPSGTILKVEEEVLKKCIEKSVKPGVKIKNKLKKIKPYLDEAKTYAKCVIAAGSLITSIATPIVGELADDVYANHLKKEASKEYTTEIYKPNTTSSIVKDEESGRHVPVHRHNWEKIVNTVHQQYENPLVGFYLIYTKLDDDCKKNDLDAVFRVFNLHYATDYRSVDDLLEKNNFKDFKEFAKYVDFEIYKMSAEEIEIENENANYTVGR